MPNESDPLAALAKDSFFLELRPAEGAQIYPLERILVDEAGVEYGGEASGEALDAYLRGGKSFFETRGVADAIKGSRPYRAWTPKDSSALTEDWFRFIKPSQRQWVTRIAKQSAGYVIPRFPPPDIEAPPISAEIRPLIKVKTSPWNEAKYVHCPSEGQAKRLDMHPRAIPLFKDATRVFFGIEGCIKADAILSQGEAAFSVPAVWQWEAPEMPEFAESYLKGRTVFIVPDADWVGNWQVRSAAIQCSSYLRGLGLDRVFVAAPPEEAGLKGVDDFLGAGNSLDDLVVIGREMPKEFDRWAGRIAAEKGRIEGASRDAKVLQALALSAGLTTNIKKEQVEGPGEVYKSTKPLMRMINAASPTEPIEAKAVRTAIESLAKRPGLISDRAITISGSLETKEGEFYLGVHGRRIDAVSEDDAPGRSWANSYYKEENWRKQPVVTVAPELRALDREPIRIGDLTDSALQRQQYRSRDNSVKRLKELRGS